jgi:hypothetical protein
MKCLPLLVLLTASACAEMPDGAQRILKEMDAAIDAAHKKAAQQLQGVQDFEARRGNVNGALAVQQKIAELTGVPAPAAVAPLVPPPGASATAPVTGRGTFTIDSRSNAGAVIGPGKKGQKVSVQYVDGLWTTNGGEKVSPDKPPHAFAQVKLAGVADGQTEVIALIPGGTKTKAYVETLKKDYAEIRLEINDTVKEDNAGEATYKVSIH